MLVLSELVLDHGARTFIIKLIINSLFIYECIICEIIMVDLKLKEKFMLNMKYLAWFVVFMINKYLIVIFWCYLINVCMYGFNKIKYLWFKIFDIWRHKIITKYV